MKNLLNRLIGFLIGFAIGLALVAAIGYGVKRLRADLEDSFWDIPTRIEIQQMLDSSGYDVGEIDGVIGPKTNRAWELYEFDKRAARSMNDEGVPK